MSGITLKIDKGQSSAFSEIMGLLQSFSWIKGMQETLFGKAEEGRGFLLQWKDWIRLCNYCLQLREKGWFDIPAYGRMNGLTG